MAKRKKNQRKKKKTLTIPELPAKKPMSWLGIAVRVWIIHLAALVVYMIMAVVGYTFMYGNTLYRVVTIVSLVFYLILCYILALRSGHRDHLYESRTSQEVSKWNTVIGSLVSQCPGFILAIALQFLSFNSAARTFYEYMYMPFAYPVAAFQESFRSVFFFPPLFAPIMMLCAYFTGRTAELREQKPSKFLIRLGARISGVTKKHQK